MNDQSRAEQIIQMIHNKQIIPIDEIRWVCSMTSKIFLDEPSVIDISSPVIIVGDVHAQIEAVIYIFQNYGSPEKNKYIFLGDYVDKGPRSVYTFVYLLANKIIYGENFVMIRGNHEDIKIARQYQFRDEVIKTYNMPDLMDDFDSVFTSLPLGVLVNNTIFCVHGGLGPAIRTVDSVREIQRPFILTDQDPMYDIVWADPQKGIDDWGNGKRGTSCSFGITPLLEFFERSNVTGLIRGHECVKEGYLYSFGDDVNFVTVFSAPNYVNSGNKAVVLIIDSNGKYEFKTFGPTLPEPEKEDPERIPKSETEQQQQKGEDKAKSQQETEIKPETEVKAEQEKEEKELQPKQETESEKENENTKKFEPEVDTEPKPETEQEPEANSGFKCIIA